MKIKHLFLMVFLAGTLFSCHNSYKEIRVTCVHPYCGGARPTPEMEEEAQKVQPCSKASFMIKGDKGVFPGLTDANGIMRVKLPPGEYKVYQSWRYNRTTPDGTNISNYDTLCLQEEWNKSALHLKVTKTGITQTSEGPIVVQCEGRENCRNNKILPH